MPRLRALRVVVAGTATVVTGTLGFLVVLVGRGRYLEDLCVTREPAGAWAPREYAVRGPLPDGLVSFRCEADGAPQYRFSFTDPIPLLGTCAVAAVVATLLLTPAAVGTGGGDLLDPRILALGAAVGLLSSVIPYSCEMVALRTIRPSVFSILMSLEPAAAALAGIVVLREFLSPEQWVAMAFIIVASVGATRSSRTVAPAPD